MMKRLLSLVTVAALLFGCHEPRTDSSTLPLPEPLIGKYRTDPALPSYAFDFVLEFKADGSYFAQGKSPGGNGSASGDWRREDGHVVLHPTSTDGGLSDYLELFEIRVDPYRGNVLDVQLETEAGWTSQGLQPAATAVVESKQAALLQIGAPGGKQRWRVWLNYEDHRGFAANFALKLKQFGVPVSFHNQSYSACSAAHGVSPGGLGGPVDSFESIKLPRRAFRLRIHQHAKPVDT